MGATDPLKAEEGTLRKMYGISIDKNSVHGSDSSDNAKTEIDFISGAVSRIGKKHGVKTPLNDLMYNIIKIKEGMYI